MKLVLALKIEAAGEDLAEVEAAAVADEVDEVVVEVVAEAEVEEAAAVIIN